MLFNDFCCSSIDDFRFSSSVGFNGASLSLSGNRLIGIFSFGSDDVISNDVDALVFDRANNRI